MIKKIEEQRIIEFVETKDIFEGKIIKAEEKFITVEVSKDSKSFKVKDKVTMKINRPTNGTNDFYVMGNNVRVVFNGNVDYSNPAQIDAIQIELITD